MSVNALYLAEVIEGLEIIVEDELKRHLKDIKLSSTDHSGEIQFHYGGSEKVLLNLKTVQSIYRVLRFPIPRPKALLGEQYFRQLVDVMEQIVTSQPAMTFHTLGIAAAGSDSTIMIRLRDALAKAAHLEPTNDKGDLLVRIRPAREGNGWECLLRLTPRPLATRPWRVRNYEAALNATVAYALALLTKPRRDDVFVNLGAGSGSIAIERMMATRVHKLLAIDHAASILTLAAENFVAAGALYPSRHLLVADMKKLPLASGVATAMAADLPFGQRSGSHQENLRLYPQVFAEAGRVAAVGANFALITHEVRLMDQLIPTLEVWELQQSFRITLRGLHPRIYVFART